MALLEQSNLSHIVFLTPTILFIQVHILLRLLDLNTNKLRVQKIIGNWFIQAVIPRLNCNIGAC